MLKILKFKEDPHEKLSNYEGSYLVNQVLSGGALILSEMDGTVLPRPFHSDFVYIKKICMMSIPILLIK